MRNFFKILIINFSVFIFLIAIIEIFFGYWFDKYNFGYLMREHRLKNSTYKVKHFENEYVVNYRRNFHGFRGKELNPSDVKSVFIGGSTGNQRYTPEEFTIVELLNKSFIKNNINLKLYNASMDGKSTFGIINDFEHWFTKLEKFSPNLFIFYIGLNDKFYRGNCDENKGTFDGSDCHYDPKLLGKIRDYIKNNSFFSFKIKQLQSKYNKKIKLRYGLFGYTENLYEDYDFINYESAKKKHKSKENKEEIFVKKELVKRLNRIMSYVERYNAKAIFITQIEFNGLSNRNLFLANETVKKFCEENNVDLIRLDEDLEMSKFDFYDPWHTTVEGSKKISRYIFDELIKYIN